MLSRTRSAAMSPHIIDAVLAGCLVVIAVLTALVADERAQEGSEAPSVWWEWLLILIPPLTVALRTKAPLAATPVTVVAQLIIWVTGLASAFAAPLVMIYSVAATGSRAGRRAAMAAAGALGATSTVGWLTAPDVGIDLAGLTVLASVIAYLLGTGAADQRAEATTLAADLAVSRSKRAAELERATVDERQRIARELHDLVGHSLSVMVVRAEAAQRVAHKKPEAATDALSAVADTARSSLAEVRRVLFALRDDDEASELAPLPGVGDIETMVADAGDATGISATCRLHNAEDRDLSPTVAAGAYRIVQESLTNTIKHAGPGTTVTVEIEALDDTLMIQVDDDGRGATNTDRQQHGSGLVGMTERAELLGGSLTAGPRPGGGFRVKAKLPLSATIESSVS
jgi:signal transduction histidine kinase